MSKFDDAFEIIVGNEGGYSNDPNDPGGATRFGITEAVARANGYEGDMKELPLDKAKSIYKAKYWDAISGDNLLWPLSLFVFDAAVNQGNDAAIKLLQKSVGVAQDGILGKGTISKALQSNQTELCGLFMADRALRYTGTRNFDIYGRGWLKRLMITCMKAGK